MAERCSPDLTNEPFIVGRAMLHPACLLALGLWWLNDDVLKARYHNFLTGKLSDLACMVVFPVLVLSVIQVVQSLRGVAWFPRRAHVLATLFGVGVLFAAINLSATVGHAYRVVFAHVLFPFLFAFHGAHHLPAISHTQDPTDLLVLPALYLAYLLAPRRA